MKTLRGIAAICVALYAIPSFSAVDAFIWFENVKGESTDASHNGWIEVSSFSWGVTNPTASMATHTSAQGCATNEIHFLVRGAAAQKLTMLTVNHAPLGPVKLDAGGQHHVLDGAMLTSCQNNLLGGNTVPTANCVMKFQRCETHANAVNTASLLGNRQPSIQPNGQLTFDGAPLDVNIASLTQTGAGNATLTVRNPSASLARFCANGKHIKDARIVCRKAGGTQQTFLVVKLKEVLISSYSVNGDGMASIGMKYGMADGSFAGFQDLH